MRARDCMTKLHIVLEILSFVVLAICFILAIIGVEILPDQIATHYNASGEIDGYDSPAVLFLMPSILLATNVSVSLILHLMPMSQWNLPFERRKEFEIIVYRDMILMMVLMELEISIFSLLFTVVIWNEWGDALLPLTVAFLVVLLATIIWLSVKAARHNRGMR